MSENQLMSSVSPKRFASLRAECWEVNAELWMDKLPSDPFRQRVFDAVFTQLQWNHAEGPDFSLADVGCGDGSFLEQVYQRNKRGRLTGIDSCRGFIEHDKDSCPNIEFIAADVEAEAFPSIGKFDCVTNILSLIEVSDLERAFKNIRKTMVDGGLLLLFVLDGEKEMERYHSDKKADPGTSIFTVNGEAVIGSHFMVGARRSVTPYYRFVRRTERYTDAMEEAGISVVRKQLVTIDGQSSGVRPQGILISGMASNRSGDD